ncbi:MAG: hypothetical protein ACLRQF_05105 [Thomasclavelia ramosa]
MIIRKATIKDLKAITAVEATCFPPAEAASQVFKKRLKLIRIIFGYWKMKEN